MYYIKVVIAFIRELLGIYKRTLKLGFVRAVWRKRNQHNRTIANTLFPIELVKVGNETYGHLNVHSYGHKGESLRIGHCCSIAGNVHFILSGSHDYERFTTFPFDAYYSPNGVEQEAKGPVIVEDDVWIGYGSIILSGVRIGKGSVVAAGSIVAKDIPPYAIWIGNKVAKYRFSESVCNQLESIDFSLLSMEKVAASALLRGWVTEENTDFVLAEVKKCSCDGLDIARKL